jgi:hypothetical protein
MGHLEKSTDDHLIPPERAGMEQHGLHNLGVPADGLLARWGAQTDDEP